MKSREERLGYKKKGVSPLRRQYQSHLAELDFRVNTRYPDCNGDYGVYGRFFLEERACLKELGKCIAKAGVLKKGVLVPGKLKDLYGIFRTLKSTVSFWHSLDTFYSVLVPGFKEMREYAELKFDSEEWIPVPWAKEDWFWSHPYAGMHMLHMSEKNVANVAFAESYEKFKRDIYTSVKPGRYLTRFFSDILTENDIRYWAEKCAARALPAELHFIAHDDKQGWLRIYRDGPQSCMSEQTCVHVYAHDKSVLRLAYLQQGDSIVARAIVREDTVPKSYIRVYPNTDTAENQLWHSRLTNMLEDQGYVHGDMEGVLLEVEEDSGAYVVPYIDTGAGSREECCVSLVHRGGREYLLVGIEGTEACSTDGTLHLRESSTCDNCGDRYDEDDMTHVEYTGMVCDHCLENEFVSAVYNSRGYERWVRADEAIRCESNDRYYTEAGAEANDIYACEVSGEYYEMDELVMTSRGWVHLDSAVQLDREDPEGNLCAIARDAVRTEDGLWIHKAHAVTVDDKVYHVDYQPETETQGE